MSNVINFPEHRGRITAEEIIKDLQAAHARDEIEHIVVVTMDKETSTHVAMSTLPAHMAVYMNNFLRLSIETLMRDSGMIK